MKKLYILCDNDKIMDSISSVAASLSGDIEIIGRSKDINTATRETISAAPDIVILSLESVRYSAKYFEKYDLIIIEQKGIYESIKLIGEKIDENEIETKLQRKILEKTIERKKYTENFFKPRGEKYDIVIIGVSTGGPNALKEILPKIKREISVPLVVVQHMPPGFTKELAKAMNISSRINFKEAEEEELKAGVGYIAPGGLNLGFIGTSKNIRIKFYEKKYGFYTPSINYSIETICDIKNTNPLIIILTGMGNDGLDGIGKIKKENRGYVITQNKESCVVYGMPRVIVDAGLADLSDIDLKNIADEINKRV